MYQARTRTDDAVGQLGERHSAPSYVGPGDTVGLEKVERGQEQSASPSGTPHVPPIADLASSVLRFDPTRAPASPRHQFSLLDPSNMMIVTVR